MMYVPDFVALYEICPYIRYLPLNNETIRVANIRVGDGATGSQAVVTKDAKWALVVANRRALEPHPTESRGAGNRREGGSKGRARLMCSSVG